jgi:hypothetical protein
MNLVKFELSEFPAQFSPFFRRRYHDIIDAGSRLSLVHLGDSANAFQYVRLTSQHQSLQRSDFLQITFS